MSGTTDLRATAVGFAAALVVFALLFLLAGVDRLVDTLVRADLRLVGAVVVVTLGWLLAWSGALRTVLDVLGVETSVRQAFLIFAGAMFSNNITPFGQAGGEPVTALLISESTDAEYETGLAAIASVDTLNFVPSITFALVGIGYFATTATLNPDLELGLALVVVLALVVPGLIYYGWKRRYELEHRAVRRLTPLIQRVGGWVPRVTVPDAEGIERRIGGFFEAIERVATNPRGLALALALSALGWFLQSVGLWLAFEAIGSSVPFYVALFAVPIGAIAGATPLPGGAGGIEAVLIGLLQAFPGIGIAPATAAVIIFRGSVYWVPTAIGGVVMSVVGARRGTSE
jgi:hypothetical protein